MTTCRRGVAMLVLAVCGGVGACGERPRTAPRAQGVLERAHALGTGRFRGWTYGEDPAKAQVDCVQFVEAVLEAVRGERVSPEVSAALRIQGLSATPGDQDAIRRAVESGDRRLAGVVHAIVDRLGEGVEVPFEAVAPGDFVQLWWRRERTEPDPADPTRTRTVPRWEGHAAVVESVSSLVPEAHFAQVKIYGSHLSLGAVGVAPYEVMLEAGPDKRVFVARFTGRKAPR